MGKNGIFVWIFVGTCLFFGCAKKREIDELDIHPVKIVTILPTPSAIVHGRVTGKVHLLSFPMDGKLEAILVDSGSVVEEGQELARLEDSCIRKRRASLLKKRDKLQFSRKTEALQQVEADIVRCQEEQERLVLRAPSKGTVVWVFEERRTGVRRGQKILSMQYSNNVYVEINRENRDYLDSTSFEWWGHSPLRPGFYFKVGKMASGPQESSATVKLVAQNPARMDGITVGSQVDLYVIKILRSSLVEDCIRIPYLAVTADGAGRPQVWIINMETQRVFSRSIKIGRVDKGDVQILKGVEENDHIVTEPVNEMYEGKRVKIVVNKPVFAKTSPHSP
ncbi:MAG: efflux RND transporter periplasmic adaptor subunit [Puniceicoccales bacterium]|jgi:multidrug efflux pump subunit AcrA (membrane-fusion protein)|nr:efflux RND transporter periplasmic adaptor subunit [Puniceicoccales bacterium]